MKRLAHLGALVLILLASTMTLASTRVRRTTAATCTGSTPCRACKNCRYCKHCAKEGGTCGVCRRARAPRRTWRQAADEAAAK
jgi:hypothetical protein